MSDYLKVERSILVKEDKEKIWAMLTESEYTKKYMFSSEVITDWKVGSEIKWTGKFLGHKVYTKGTILEYVPYEHIKYTSFDPSLGIEDTFENYLITSYTLTQKDDGIEVKFTIENFGDSKEKYEESAKGVDKVILPGFKKILKMR